MFYFAGLRFISMPKYDVNTFIEEYLIHRNITQAAIKAGYSERTAHSQGSRLLKSVKVQEALSLERKKARMKFDITQERVLNELARIAFGVTADLVSIDDEGQVIFKSLDELDDDQKAFISELNSTRVDREGIVTITTKVKTYDKLRALEMLSRYLGLFEKDNNQKLVINVTLDQEDEEE